MANTYTAGYGEASFNDRRDERSEDLSYLRPKMFQTGDTGDTKRVAKSESNKLAYEIKKSKNFHDITVFVSDYDKNKERKEESYKSFKEADDKRRQDRAGRMTEREPTEIENEEKKKKNENEEKKKKKEIADISEGLRKKGVDVVDLPKRTQSVLEERKKSKLQKEENDLAKAMSKAYLGEANTEMELEMNTGEILVVPNRPGMAAAMAVGDWVVPHSSIKGMGRLNRHPLVQEALDKLGKVEEIGHKRVKLHVNRDSTGAPVGKMEVWHGNCAEVGAVSDYLHNTSKVGRMTLEKAKEYFRKADAEIFAHRPSSSDGTPATDETAEVPACGSCHFMLEEFGITHRGPKTAEPKTAEPKAAKQSHK